MAYTTPNAPGVLTVNSDTIRVEAGSIDAGATHVDIYLEQTVPNAVAATLVSHALKAGDPFDVTDLIPGATYLVTTKAWSATDVSLSSSATQIVMPRLFVMGHISPTAAGVTEVRVDIGHLPDVGRYFPSSLIGGPYSLKNFDLVTTLWNGIEYARLVVQITAMPTPKIRDGDFVCMTISKPIGEGQEKWTPILYNALVREDAPTYVPPSDGEPTDLMFDDEFYDPAYFLDDYFA